MSEPTTAAGKRLLRFLAKQRSNDTDNQAWRNGVQYAEECLAMDLPKIEREAREQGKQRATAGDAAFLDDLTADWEQHEREAIAAALARVSERVEGLPWKFDGSAINRAAVLAILDEEAASHPTSHQPTTPERDGEHE